MEDQLVLWVSTLSMSASLKKLGAALPSGMGDVRHFVGSKPGPKSAQLSDSDVAQFKASKG